MIFFDIVGKAKAAAQSSTLQRCLCDLPMVMAKVTHIVSVSASQQQLAGMKEEAEPKLNPRFLWRHI